MKKNEVIDFVYNTMAMEVISDYIDIRKQKKKKEKSFFNKITSSIRGTFEVYNTIKTKLYSSDMQRYIDKYIEPKGTIHKDKPNIKGTRLTPEEVLEFLSEIKEGKEIEEKVKILMTLYPSIKRKDQVKAAMVYQFRQKFNIGLAYCYYKHENPSR